MLLYALILLYLVCALVVAFWLALGVQAYRDEVDPLCAGHASLTGV